MTFRYVPLTSYEILSVNWPFNKQRFATESEQMSGRGGDEGRAKSSNQFEYNTRGFNRNHRQSVGVRGCPKVRGANKREEARRREEESKGTERIKNRWKKVDAEGENKQETEKELEKKEAKNERRDEERTEGRMNDVGGGGRPGIRMQIDVVTHDATARESHTKSRA